jgi:two-component system, NarL family, response regulator LiaR
VNKPIIRILIVDDHPVVRKGTRALLEEIPDMEVAGEAGNGLDAVQLFDETQPDVVLMDLVMPKMNGIDATRGITGKHPGAKILVLTSFLGDENIYPAIKAGAIGYVLKDTDPDDLINAIRRVYHGEVTLPPMIANRILNELGNPTDPNPTPEPLTTREIEVLQKVARGKSNNEIAKELFIAEVTVRTHISRILEKLHLTNRVQATLYALREGITPFPPE